MNYAKNGDHATALLNVLFTIIGKSSAGGATQQDVIDAYRDAKGHLPSNKTIERIIERLNNYFDGSKGYSFAPASSEQLEARTSPIIKKGRGENRRYLFTREIKKASQLDDPLMAFLMSMQNNPHERNVMPHLFEVLMKIMIGDIFSRISEWYQLQGEIEKYVLIKGFQPVHIEENKNKIETILTCIRDRKRLYFQYHHIGSGELQKREVAPYGLLCQQNIWYLSGLCYQQKELRLFRVDHIQELRRVEMSDYSMPADFSLEKQYGTSWGIWSDNQVVAEIVKIRVEERLAEKFKVTRYHSSQQITELPNGSLEVVFQVKGAEEMLPWLMMWGPTIEVLEPEWLRDTVVDNLQSSLSIYS